MEYFQTDLSISNLIVKTGTWFGGGVLLSALLFRRAFMQISSWKVTHSDICSLFPRTAMARLSPHRHWPRLVAKK